MKYRILVLLFIFVSVSLYGAPAQASSPAANSSLIAALLEQLTLLQQKLAEILSSTSEPEPDIPYVPVMRPLTPTVPSVVDVSKRPTLESFPIATNPWSAKINPTGIPTDAYKAYYFNTNAPATIISTKTVPAVAISYAWSDIGIKSEDFGGFWIGQISVPADGKYLVTTAESWSESRVIINHRLIKTQGNDSASIYLTKGTYTIEVEFVNNWHTTDFSMNVMPEVKEWSREDLASELKKVTSGAVNTYVGVYESANENRDIIVDLSKSTDASILFLASYSQVNWVFKNPHAIKAVVVGSYDKGIQVRGVPTGVPVYYTSYDVLPFEYSLEVSCANYEDYLDACEDIDQLLKVDDEVQWLTGKKINTFTGTYSADTLVVPGTVVTEAVRTRILNSYTTTRQTAALNKQKTTLDGVFR